MRRSLILSTVLAASAAVLGACSGAANNGTVTKPNTVATPAPIQTASPIGSPVASPAKPGTTPEVKKTDEKTTGKDVKPAPAETPKTK